MGDRFWQVSPAVRSGINVLLGTQSGHIACRSLHPSFCPVRALLRLPGPWGGRLGAHRVSSRMRSLRCTLSGRRQGRQPGVAEGLSLLKAPQPTQRTSFKSGPRIGKVRIRQGVTSGRKLTSALSFLRAPLCRSSSVLGSFRRRVLCCGGLLCVSSAVKRCEVIPELRTGPTKGWVKNNRVEDSRDKSLRSRRASKSSRLACPKRRESDGFWHPVVLAHL